MWAPHHEGLGGIWWEAWEGFRGYLEVPHHQDLGGGLGAPHRGAGGLQLQDDSRGVLELAGGSVAARVPVGGATLAPCSLGDPCFGLGGWARAGRGQGLELGGGGGARGGLPTGAQLLLLLDDELLLLLRWWLRLHRLRRLLQELGGLQWGIGCEDSNGDRDLPSSPAPQPQGPHPQDPPLGGCCSLCTCSLWCPRTISFALAADVGSCAQAVPGGSPILGAMPVQHPRLQHSMESPGSHPHCPSPLHPTGPWDPMGAETLLGRTPASEGMDPQGPKYRQVTTYMTHQCGPSLGFRVNSLDSLSTQGCPPPRSSPLPGVTSGWVAAGAVARARAWVRPSCPSAFLRCSAGESGRGPRGGPARGGAPPGGFMARAGRWGPAGRRARLCTCNGSGSGVPGQILGGWQGWGDSPER